MENLPEWQKGWLAGIIDADGYICSGIGSGRIRHITIGVMMTHEPTIRMIAKLTEMGSLLYKESVARTRSRAAWRWEMNSRIDVYTFLKTLLSYFFTKSEHAKVALEYIERRIGKISYTIIDRDLIDKLKKLNKRGVD